MTINKIQHFGRRHIVRKEKFTVLFSSNILKEIIWTIPNVSHKLSSSVKLLGEKVLSTQLAS